MKKFSLLLMIVLIVGAIFISCSAEPSADATKVATVALSLDTAKELQVYTEVETLPQASGLYWFYTATKRNGGFTTGQTSGLTPIQTDEYENHVAGLPGVIGYDGTANSGTWFSTGDWTFSFYGYDENNVLVYQKEGYELEVEPATEQTNIGATASITLELKDDPRSGSTFKMHEVYVELGTAYDSVASYFLKAYVDGVVVTTIDGGHDNDHNKVTFTTAEILKTFAKETEANPDTGLNDLHLVEFKMYKGDDTETVYASGSIGLIARMGYTYTIYGALDSLESVAWVGINATLPANLDSATQNITELTISNESQLRAFAAYVNQGNNCAGMTIKLANDITLTQPWTPIGNSYRGQENGAYFAGTFDGRKSDNSGNYTISGLRLASDAEVAKDSNGEYVFGLFGVVKNATIQNLNMTNVQINKVTAEGYYGENVAAVVGYSEGKLTLKNITVGASEDDNSYINGAHVAGVISRAYGKSTGIEIKIINCTNYADITASNNIDGKAKAAGIAAYVSGQGADVTIEGCKNYGAISSTDTNNAIAAGIVVHGFNDSYTDDYTVTGNANSGDITLSGGSPLYAKISAECYQNPVENVDSISATGNSSTGTVTVNDTDVTDNTPLVRDRQGGTEVNVNN